nr:hypothetical protein [Nannocystis pusilla]
MLGKVEVGEDVAPREPARRRCLVVERRGLRIRLVGHRRVVVRVVLQPLALALLTKGVPIFAAARNTKLCVESPITTEGAADDAVAADVDRRIGARRLPVIDEDGRRALLDAIARAHREAHHAVALARRRQEADDHVGAAAEDGAADVRHRTGLDLRAHVKVADAGGVGHTCRSVRHGNKNRRRAARSAIVADRLVIAIMRSTGRQMCE